LKKITQKILSMGLALFIAFGASLAAQALTGDDGTTNWDFIVPVTHQKTAPAGYTPIRTAQELSNIRNNLSGNYILMNNIDLSAWGNWQPIGDATTGFAGIFDGNGYAVKYMSVNIKRTGTVYAGLFGYTNSGSAIKNLGVAGSVVYAESLKNPYVADPSFAGGIVGYSASSISNCYFTGLVGAVLLTVPDLAGGIAGYADAPILHCFSMGTVRGKDAGGIAGRASSISYCFNTAKVSASSGNTAAGGIAGNASVEYCYNTGAVSSSASFTGSTVGVAGGIVGLGSVSNCYNTGAVTAHFSTAYPGGHRSCAGGIAGEYSGVSNSYNAGEVTATSQYAYNQDAYAGGVAGFASGVSNSYYIDTNAVGEGGTALSAAQMKQQASYVGFDFSTIWVIEPNGYPTLQALPVKDPAHTHITKQVTVDSTCADAGVKYTLCEVCGEATAQSSVPMKPHTYGAWELSATLLTHTCTVCGFMENEPVEKIVISGNGAINYKGSTKLTASIKTYSNITVTNIPLDWSSKNTGVATVDQNGNVTATGRGTTEIVAKSADGYIDATFAVTVNYSIWQWLIVIFLFGWIWY